MKLLHLLAWLALLSFLTILTQIGGIVLLFCLPLFPLFNRYFITTLQRRLAKFTFYLLIYTFTTFILIPPIAARFGRVPLPVFGNANLKPVNVGYCLLNRHYVKPDFKIVIEKVAKKLSQEFPDTKVKYLDANFPFWNEFPLLPHLSHDDGKKLDITFFYLNVKTNAPTNQKPSFTGYGVFEKARKGEVNQTEICKSKGYWQYDFNRYMGLINWKRAFALDEVRTKRLMALLTQEKIVSKILIEPHLKARLKLKSPKIRFQGCQAARHDDHLHVQMN